MAMRFFLLAAIFLTSINSFAGEYFLEPGKSFDRDTIFFQNTVMEERHLVRVSSLLSSAAKHKVLHIDYVRSAIVELESAIGNNREAGKSSSIDMVRFSDMGEDLLDRLNLLKKYYDIVKYRNDLKTSSRYIYGGELKGFRPHSTNLSNFEKTIAIVDEVVSNLRLVNASTGIPDAGRIKGMKYLDYNRRML